MTTTTVLEDVVFVFLVYKQSQYLRTTLPSAINQTQYPGLLLVMDDASPDDSAKVIQQILADAPKDLNVQFEHNQENIGLIAQLNKLVNRFENKLIVLQAGDDESYPNRLEETYKAWIEQGKPSLVLANYDCIDDDGCITKHFDPGSKPQRYTLKRLLRRRAMVFGCCAAFDSDLMSHYGPISTNVINEDRVNAFRAFYRKGIHYIHKPLLRYRSEAGISAFDKRTSTQRREKLRIESSRELADLNNHLADLSSVVCSENIAKEVRQRRKLVYWMLRYDDDRKLKWLMSGVLEGLNIVILLKIFKSL